MCYEWNCLEVLMCYEHLRAQSTSSIYRQVGYIAEYTALKYTERGYASQPQRGLDKVMALVLGGM